MITKRVARGKRLGRRYCKRHGLEYKPLRSPPPSMAKVRARREAVKSKRAERRRNAEHQRLLREHAQIAAFFEVS